MFDNKELSMLKRMRNQQTRWRLTRWILLCGGSLLAILASTLFLYILHSGHDFSERDRLYMFVFAYPNIVVCLVLAGLLVGLAIAHWDGNPVHLLILKLSDEHLHDKGKGTTASLGS